MRNLLSIIIVLLSITSIYSQNENISNGNLFEGEPYIKVDPQDENHIIVSWMGWAGIVDQIVIKTRVSFDGGETWSTTSQLPHTSTGYTSADSAIDFDINGNVYIVYIDSNGGDPLPYEGGIYLSISQDGGLTFQSPVEVLNIDVDPDRIPVDRPWIAIDRSSASTQGTIYVTSMNAGSALPDYHPYVSISTNGGLSFFWKELDGPGWFSGNTIPQAMPTPSISADGTFNAIYPSFVFSQNVLPQFIRAKSVDGGATFNYNTAYEGTSTTTPDPLPKKGYILRTNPANADQMIFLSLSNETGDLDVTAIESFDGGTNWTAPFRINDDPIGNNRMQDLVWADYNNNGDVVVSWRDRRNADSDGYETQSEIWAAFKPQGATIFEPNFQLTDELVEYDNVLAGAGNDFMSIQLTGEIIHAVWGDPRSDVLNIWYQKSRTDGTILGLQEIASEGTIQGVSYPNPTSGIVYIDYANIENYTLYDAAGRPLVSINDMNAIDRIAVDMKPYSSGTYFITLFNGSSTWTSKIIKK